MTLSAAVRPLHEDPWLTVYQGDARTVLAELPERSVHCVVTSPPYWGLRDYGTATWIGGDAKCDHLSVASSPRAARPNVTGSGIGKGGPSFNAQDYGSRVYRSVCGKCGAIRQDSQLGLEPTPELYVEHMVQVFREVKRVLRDDGTLWLNLGDSYASHDPGGYRQGEFLNPDGREPVKGQARNRAGQYRPSGLKPKDLIGIPWRVAFALQADGWYLRSDIIWSKPNPMPESVTDRPTKSHEYLFLLSKSPRYFYDAEAVREGPAESSLARIQQPTFTQQTGGPKDYRNGTNPNRSVRQILENFAANPGRNLRSVWTISTQPYPGAHFATFPEALVEPCIKAGTSERGVCPECGAPWVRVVERTGGRTNGTLGPKLAVAGSDVLASASGRMGRGAGWREQEPLAMSTTGWHRSCTHELIPVPARVLDCFAGSGTTGLVAQRLSRRAILIDLSTDYMKQLMARNHAVPLGL